MPGMARIAVWKKAIYHPEFSRKCGVDGLRRPLSRHLYLRLQCPNGCLFMGIALQLASISPSWER